MPLPSSGQISLGDARTEFEGSGQTAITTFRPTGAFVNLGTPSTGQFALSDLYNKDITSGGLTSNSNIQGWAPNQLVSNVAYIPSCWAFIDLYAPDTSTNTIKIGFFCGNTSSPSSTTYAYRTYIDTVGNDIDSATWSFKYYYGDSSNKSTSISVVKHNSFSNPAHPGDTGGGYTADTWYALSGYNRLEWNCEYQSIGGSQGTAFVIQDLTVPSYVTLEFRAVTSSTTYYWEYNIFGAFPARNAIDLSSTYGPAGPL
jgi:hypothetical protein